MPWQEVGATASSSITPIRLVAIVVPGLGRTSNDAHEFTVLDDGTAISTIYQPIQYDLAPYGVDQPIGWLVDALFQRIDVTTGNVLFEWRASDHFTPESSFFPLDVASGVGASANNPYDYL